MKGIQVAIDPDLIRALADAAGLTGAARQRAIERAQREDDAFVDGGVAIVDGLTHLLAEWPGEEPFTIETMTAVLANIKQRMLSR